MKRLGLMFVVLAMACSSPGTKQNASTNNTNGAQNNDDGNNENNTNENNATNNSTSGATIPRRADYDQTCTLDPDCALVPVGDPCGCGGSCPGALNEDAAVQYETDRSAIECDDSPVDCPHVEPCAEHLAVCTSAGNCEAIPLVNRTVDQFDQTCQVDSDCVLVETGEICSDCRCPGGVLSRDALSDYEEAYPPPDCSPGPSPCDCRDIEPWCNDGMCDIRDR